MGLTISRAGTLYELSRLPEADLTHATTASASRPT